MKLQSWWSFGIRNQAVVLAKLGFGCVFKSQWLNKWDCVVQGKSFSLGKASVTEHLSLNLHLTPLTLCVLMHT